MAVATAIAVVGAAAAAPTPAAAGWCYDSYWGWYWCSYVSGIGVVGNTVAPVTQALGLPSPASITGLLVPPPAAAAK